MDGSLLKKEGYYNKWYPDPVVRCRIYVCMTRVHMSLRFVNERIQNGLLGDWLLALRASERRVKALPASENQTSKASGEKNSHKKSQVIEFKKAANLRPF